MCHPARACHLDSGSVCTTCQCGWGSGNGQRTYTTSCCQKQITVQAHAMPPIDYPQGSSRFRNAKALHDEPNQVASLCTHKKHSAQLHMQNTEISYMHSDKPYNTQISCADIVIYMYPYIVIRPNGRQVNAMLSSVGYQVQQELVYL